MDQDETTRTAHRALYALRDAERWYVVNTQPNREAGACAQLEAQGFRVFLPRILKTVRHARKLKTVKAPAFPGYLFVILDAARDRWRSVNGTFGVIRLVMANDAPMPTPVGVVETLLDTMDETGLCRFDRDLAVGQKVKVTVGPLAETMGRLVRLDANGRVRVLLAIMSGEIAVTMDQSAVVASA
jgi:transcription antitermination factor NusG